MNFALSDKNLTKLQEVSGRKIEDVVRFLAKTSLDVFANPNILCKNENGSLTVSWDDENGVFLFHVNGKDFLDVPIAVKLFQGDMLTELRRKPRPTALA